MAETKKTYNLVYKDFDRTYTTSTTSITHNYQDLCLEYILACCTATTHVVSAITSTSTDIWHTVDFYITRNDESQVVVELKEREDNDWEEYPLTNLGEKGKLDRMYTIYKTEGKRPYIIYIQSNGEVTSYDLAYIYENNLYKLIKNMNVQKNNDVSKNVKVQKDMVLYYKSNAYKKYKIKNWEEIRDKLKYRAESESENN